MKAVGRRSEVAGRRWFARDTDPPHPDLRPTIRDVRSRLQSVLSIVLATLREIFDENAYTRFLQLHRLEPSRDAYAQFVREHSRRRERRARCC